VKVVQLDKHLVVKSVDAMVVSKAEKKAVWRVGLMADWTGEQWVAVLVVVKGEPMAVYLVDLMVGMSVGHWEALKVEM
jgi:hypothetical protein